ncbi:MAG TPA: cob(I)yrinic acid a,c-diamide adenosyltransferase, partial [Dehalococcoidia bacterium]|nr:cob(I)yrinic acid a,c-diamide adenosyltransferase [Dehalococcoidia bacterium]
MAEQFQHPFQPDPDKPPILQDPKKFTQGLVQVYTGNGKGKSTAAFGTAMRAIGTGFRVAIVCFMKGDQRYGEQNIPQLPNLLIENFGPAYLVDMNNVSPDEKAQGRAALDRARDLMLSGDYDVIILDEANVAVSWHLIEIDDLMELVARRPADVELIITGRYAHGRLIEAADLVT